MNLQQRLAAGENEAFVELYDACGDRLYRFVALQCGSGLDAADVVQEVFLRLARSHRQLGKVKNLMAYVFRVARNEMQRLRARRKPEATPEQANEVPAATSEASVELVDLVQSALHRLPLADREIVQLKVYSELTLKEIAEIVDMPANTVATRYRRAAEKLRRWLEVSQCDTESK